MRIRRRGTPPAHTSTGTLHVLQGETDSIIDKLDLTPSSAQRGNILDGPIEAVYEMCLHILLTCDDGVYLLIERYDMMTSATNSNLRWIHACETGGLVGVRRKQSCLSRY